MRKVRFKDGSFGIRKGIFIYKFKSLGANSSWWSLRGRWISNCKGSEKLVDKILDSMLDNGSTTW